MATKWRTNRVMGSLYVKKDPEDFTDADDHTIANDALTPREILERHANGMDLKRFERFGIYDKADTDLKDLVLSSKFEDLTQLDSFLRKKNELEAKIAQAQELKSKIEDPTLNPPDKTGVTTPEETPTT